MSTPIAPVIDSPGRRSRAVASAAYVAAALLGASAIVGALMPGEVSDHATRAGRLSEALAGSAFVAAAAALALLAPDGRRARTLFVPGAIATALVGLTMWGVTLTGQEPPEPWVTILVLVQFAGLVGAGVVGWRVRRWPWWVAVLLALFLPVMFLVPNPVNAVVMALVWVSVGWSVRHR